MFWPPDFQKSSLSKPIVHFYTPENVRKHGAVASNGLKYLTIDIAKPHKQNQCANSKRSCGIYYGKLCFKNRCMFHVLDKYNLLHEHMCYINLSYKSFILFTYYHRSRCFYLFIDTYVYLITDLITDFSFIFHLFLPVFTSEPVVFGLKTKTLFFIWRLDSPGICLDLILRLNSN